MLNTIFMAYSIIFILMLFVWLIYLRVKNPSIVDVAWPIGLMTAGLVILQSDVTSRTLIAGALLLTWGTRLAFFLWYTRIRKHHIDKRYLQISANWKMSKSFGFFLNYQFQGILILLIALVFYPITLESGLPLMSVDYLAIFLILTGIFGETLADFQLLQFKKLKQGKVCNAGLWQYSRHPNYFCDWLVWLGFALLGSHSSIFYIGFIAPTLLYLIFNYLTGPITENASVKSRGQAFINYQKETNMFFPWFKH